GCNGFRYSGFSGMHYEICKENGSTKLSDFPESIAALQKAQAQRFKMLQILVPVFQDPDLYINHNLRCTGSESFRGAITRNDPAWVSVGDDITKIGDLGGRLPGFLRGLIKLRGNNGNSYRMAILEILWPVNSGIADPHDTLIRVQRRVYKTAMGG